MRRASRDAIIAVCFGVLSFVLAFGQRPGLASSDTKIDLHVDPTAFLSRVASLWNPSIDLGAVHSVQYSGYLWPMGSFFAGLQQLGVGSWVSERLWLGVLYALSAWGVLRLMDLLAGRPRGIGHVVAAAFYVLNPYTVVFTGRTSVALIGYAALPWLLIVVRHGVRGARRWRDARGWWWAAAFALILTSLSGGINAAVVGWMLVGPLVLALYEPIVGSVRLRDSLRFLVQVGVLGALASLWWIVPLLLGSRYGIDFLQFTEKPFTIWAANGAGEVLRLMAYWTSYIGVGFHGVNHPYFTESGTLLFNPLTVAASLLLPALGVAAFGVTRRWRYAPFLLLVLLVGAAIEVAGFPNGTPIRGLMELLYEKVLVLRFMRTTQKAAPLVAIGEAGLLGFGATYAWTLLRSRPPSRGRRAAAVLGPAALAALIALAALSLVRGTAVEKQLTWKRIPSAWTQAGHDLDRTLAPNSRAVILPGQVFAHYRWGGTVDAILPRLTRRPVAVRYETPYSDPHAYDLLYTLDDLVQQDRLYPGELRPLLGLMGAGAVITGSDDDIGRSGAVDPETAASVLDRQGLGRPAKAYGPVRRFPAPAMELGPSGELPQVRRYDLPVTRGLVHVDTMGSPTVVDGGAAGVAGLAALGGLPRRAPLLYAGDLSGAELRRTAAAGADVVVTDSNRRQRFLPEFTGQNLGRVLAGDEPIDKNWAVVNPFENRGTDAQTVTALQGARYIRAPEQGGLLVFPEHAPVNAFDGDPSTVWAANRYLPPRDRWIEIGFERPRDVPYVDLERVEDRFGLVTQVNVGGVTARVGPGVTRVPVHLRHVSALRVTITHVVQPPGNLRGSGGFREIRIPGLHVRDTLRTPILASRALAGAGLRRSSLSYVFQRTTGDAPLERDRVTGSPLLELAANRTDPERALTRVFATPAARTYRARAWVQPAVDAPDDVLDRAAGWRGGARYTSSDRFHDRAAFRASSAFDASAGTAWIGTWIPRSAPPPWVQVALPRPLVVRSLTLVPSALLIRRPTRVRISFPGGRTPVLTPGPGGVVTLPRPVRTRALRLTVLAARFVPGLPARERMIRAVGVASLRVPGLPPARIPQSGPLRAPCGSAAFTVAGRRVLLRPRGTVAELNAGRPLRAVSCGPPVRIGRGIQLARAARGPFTIDLLDLRSPAPEAAPRPAGGGVVTAPGQLGNASLHGARVALRGPSWLVLGQSFSRGWRASCDGRSLGAPRPIDVFANGWRAPAGCRAVSFDFAPQRIATVSYAVAALACLLLATFLVAGYARAGRRRRRPARPRLLPDLQTPAMSLPRALGVALVGTLPLAFLFAARTGILIFPALTLILWKGVRPRTLSFVAAGLIGVAVPLLYLIEGPVNRGGYNFEYSLQTIWGHWTAVAALVLLAVVCGRALAGARETAPPAVAPPPAPVPPPAPAPEPPVGSRRS